MRLAMRQCDVSIGNIRHHWMDGFLTSPVCDEKEFELPHEFPSSKSPLLLVRLRLPYLGRFDDQRFQRCKGRQGCVDGVNGLVPRLDAGPVRVEFSRPKQ